MRRVSRLFHFLRNSSSLQKSTSSGNESALRRNMSYWQYDRSLQHFERKKGFFQRNRALIGSGVALCAGVYYWRSREVVPFTGRTHAIMFVSQEQERELGKMMFEMEKEQAKLNGTLLRDNHPDLERVRRVGLKVAKAAEEGAGDGNYQHIKNLDWQFAVISSPMANAFVLPGGKVVVFSGLLRLLGNDDELAAVLAHEIGHVLARHQAERLSQLGILNIAQLISFFLFGIRIPTSFWFLGIFLPYSRRAEYEADTIGLQLAARACFDPKASTSMLQKINRVEKEQEQKMGYVPGFLRTHPLTEERVKRVTAELPKACQAYEEKGCRAIREGFTPLTPMLPHDLGEWEVEIIFEGFPEYKD